MVCTQVANYNKVLKVAGKDIAPNPIVARDRVLIVWRANAIQPDKRTKAGDLYNRPEGWRIIYRAEVLCARLVRSPELRIKPFQYRGKIA